MTKQEYLTMIKQGQKQVKYFNITVTRKNGHYSMLYEVKNLYNSLRPINSSLFDPEYEYYWCEYKKNIDLKKTKKELDHSLKLCINYLNRQLYKIQEYVYNDEIKGLV